MKYNTVLLISGRYYYKFYVMRPMTIIFILSLTACDRSSSPEGRLSIRLEQIQNEMDSIKKQNAAVLDSLSRIKEELKGIRRQNK